MQVSFHPISNLNLNNREMLKTKSYTNNAVNIANVSFKQSSHFSNKNLKAVFLGVLTILPVSGITSRLSETKIVNNVDKFVSNSKLIENSAAKNNYKKIVAKLDNIFTFKGTLFAQEPNIIIRNEAEIPQILTGLSRKTPLKQSYYYDYNQFDGLLDNSDSAVLGRKLSDYNLIINNVPENVRIKGDLEIAMYKSSVLSIIETCDEFGAMYIKNIPDKENIMLHAQGLKRLSDASKKIQGCQFKNAALFNGLSADELIKKVVIPTEKIANGQLMGENQKVLIFITNEAGVDTNNAFIENYSKRFFTETSSQMSYRKLDYDESFLGHYDCIIPIQPEKLSADFVLNNSFSAIEKSLAISANTDVAYIAHSSESGVTLSNLYDASQRQSARMDMNDFQSIENGGQPYAQVMKKILKPNSRFIAMGCDSEKFQSVLGDNIHYFGTPYNNLGWYSLGFNNGKLTMASSSSDFYKNKGLLYRITESDLLPVNVPVVKSFSVDKNLSGKNNQQLDKIILDKINSGAKTFDFEKYHSAVAKENGMVMEFDIW